VISFHLPVLPEDRFSLRKVLL